MRTRFLAPLCLFASIALSGLFVQAGLAQSWPLVTEPIQNTSLVRLPGNVRSAANAANDRGPVDASLPLNHILIQLQRPAETEAALKAYLAELNDSSLPNSPR